MSTHAKAAKQIKALLKSNFKSIKFSARSNSFAGGDSVSVEWVDGPSCREVGKLIDHFQYGHFDGMTDCYEYSNQREDIPQVKFVSYRREISPEKWNEIFQIAKTEYADLEGCEDIESNLKKPFSGLWTAKDFLYQKVSTLNLSQPITLELLRAGLCG